MRFGILGGGLTGLTLGHLLNQRGIDVEILEKNNECGGLMRTLQENGFTFDYGGSHIIFSKDKNVLKFILSLLGNNKNIVRRNTKILYAGKYVKYPFENGLSDLSKQDNFECLYYYILNNIKKEKGELKNPSNLKEWCYYTFGRGIAEKYLVPYNEKIWKYPVDEITLDWVKRIPKPPVKDIIQSALGIKTEGYTHQLNFYYPKCGGIQILIKALEKKTNKFIFRNYEVKSVNKENEKWKISNGKEKREYDRIISTIPINDLINKIDAPKKIKTYASELRYNSLITIMIGLDIPRINDFSWLYIPDKNVLTHRISFPSNYSIYTTPRNNSSILAEITCNYRDIIWKMKDEELLEITINDLARLNFFNKNKVCFKKIKRIKYAYVIDDLKRNQNIKLIKNYFKNEGIDLIGRFAEFEYLNMDDCIKKSIRYCNNFSNK